MLPPLLDTEAGSPRDRWLWAAIIALVVGQVVAFWLLCLGQVRQAELRHLAAQSARVTPVDCPHPLSRAASNAGRCAAPSSALASAR